MRVFGASHGVSGPRSRLLRARLQGISHEFHREDQRQVQCRGDPAATRQPRRGGVDADAAPERDNPRPDARPRQTILNFGESCREYTRNILSPAIHREFDRPGRKAPLVLEADSATFVVRGTFQSFKKHAPEYSLREAALNPLNLANQADAAETEIIEQFRADPKMPDVRGFRLKGSVEHFYVARPIVVEAKCLVCHDSPDTAPAELVAGYGRNHGFGWKEGEVNSILIVEVPTEDIRAQQAGVRWRFLIVFGALAVLLAVMIPLLFNRLVNRRLVHAGRVMEQVTGTLLEPLEGSAAGSDIAATPIPDSGQFAKSLTPPQTPLPVTTSRRLTEHRMPVDSGDELGILGATFNRMADAVRDSHLDLEARVRRRTKELSRTNTALEQAKQQLEEHARRLTESLEKLRQSEARRGPSSEPLWMQSSASTTMVGSSSSTTPRKRCSATAAMPSWDGRLPNSSSPRTCAKPIAVGWHATWPPARAN